MRRASGRGRDNVALRPVGPDFLGGIGAYQIVGLAGLLVLLPLPDLRAITARRAASSRGPAPSLK